MSKALFDAIRSIKGSGLTQTEVNRVNRALMSDVSCAVAAPGAMSASQAAVDLVHSFETCATTAYKDPGSINGLPITNGWGSTTDLEGKPIKLGVTWDRKYSNAVFFRDKIKFETGLNLLLAGSKTTQTQFDALFSFAYNVGLDIDDDDKAEGLGDSTLLRKHRAGDYVGARAEFAKWNKNDGVVMRGLTRRRAAEAEMYGA